jgi:hypothetical protein
VNDGKWRRIERRDDRGRVQDWVEVGECESCGRGVDRVFPSEYRLREGSIVCRECCSRLEIGAPGSAVVSAPSAAITCRRSSPRWFAIPDDNHA